MFHKKFLPRKFGAIRYLEVVTPSEETVIADHNGTLIGLTCTKLWAYEYAQAYFDCMWYSECV